MSDNTPKIKYRKDYTPPDFFITDARLEFDLNPEKTAVKSTLIIERNGSHDRPLIMDGEFFATEEAAVDGVTLDLNSCVNEENKFVVKDVPEKCTFTAKTVLDPSANTALEGLYLSGSIFCTQNEPEGFRRITWFIDRPDNMCRFTTKISAPEQECPVMLSNGNPAASGTLPDGKHWIEWEDPFPKPSYLYALVAGNLDVLKDTFVTKSGREIDCRIYCDPGNAPKCRHAMDSLKKSMKWDEERFGLEYDLDIYMIVAVDSFNMGAMENKGLNVFNSHYVLADDKSATDMNFMGIEGVIGHEYFHNWTGNRITCRDWFQLTLKEGLTVFRDQEFSSDMQSRGVKRIEDVLALRNGQFPEDAGPNSHPIRPDQYIEINNFYTATVYEKGAEVIRMIYTLLGEEGFQKGVKEYVSRHDGQAVTCDDFVRAMEKGGGKDLRQFMRWYSSAGTPLIEVKEEYSAGESRYKLTLTQLPPEGKEFPLGELHVPVLAGLLDREGKDLLSEEGKGNSRLLELTEKEMTFEFNGIKEKPVLSLNRAFSAPVKFRGTLSLEEKLFLMGHDSDSFNRWDAGQGVYREYLKRIIEDTAAGREPEKPEALLDALSIVLNDEGIDDYFRTYMFSPVSETELFQEYEEVDFDSIHRGREWLLNAIGKEFHDGMDAVYEKLQAQGDFSLSFEAMGKRSFRNMCLSFMMRSGAHGVEEKALKHYKESKNMTETLGGLNALRHGSREGIDRALEDFYGKWKDNTLVIMKWLALNASLDREDVLEKVIALEDDPVFDWKIPNLVRALIGSFIRNSTHFHRKDGGGYRYLADRLLKLDRQNPLLSSAMARGYQLYPKLDAVRKEAMREELQRIIGHKDLSRNTYEIVKMTLESDK